MFSDLFPEFPEVGANVTDLSKCPRTYKAILSITNNKLDKKKWDKEEWKNIPDYNGLYQISSHGRVRSLCRSRKTKRGHVQTISKKILKPIVVTNVYAVQIQDSLRYIHKLVAEAFVTNSTNYSDIIWVDNNRFNNYMGNLRWGCVRGLITHSEEIKAGKKVKNNLGSTSILSKKSKPVFQIALTGEVVAEWASALEAVRVLNMERTAILKACAGQGFRAYGFFWKYKKDFLNELSKKDALLAE